MPRHLSRPKRHCLSCPTVPTSICNPNTKKDNTSTLPNTAPPQSTSSPAVDVIAVTIPLTTPLGTPRTRPPISPLPSKRPRVSGPVAVRSTPTGALVHEAFARIAGVARSMAQRSVVGLAGPSRAFTAAIAGYVGVATGWWRPAAVVSWSVSRNGW